MSAHTALEMPALNCEVVTQAHANICAERGHATHKVNGEIQPHCPRCGEDTETETPKYIIRKSFNNRLGVLFEVCKIESNGHPYSLCKWATEIQAEAHIAHLKSINY